LLDELTDTRNLLIFYRLLHYHDKIPDIKLNLFNREKQLFKPVLRIFQKTETLRVLLPVISKYVSEKRQKNSNTLHAFLYRIIKDLIIQENGYDLSSSLIWKNITLSEILEGEFIPNKPLSYDTVEFGLISQKMITQILQDVFGARKSTRHGKSRGLIFDPNKIERLGKIYELSLDIKVKENGTDGTDGTDIGLTQYQKDNLQSEDSPHIGNIL